MICVSWRQTSLEATVKRKSSRKASIAINLDTDQVFNRQEVARFCGFSVQTLDRLWRVGRGPARVQLSPRRLGATGRSILAYLNRSAV
jgi:predicted DNA-binding transcriptional regulator AlpA